MYNRATYIVFRDEVGKHFVLWDDMVKKSLFAGSKGKLKEVERKTITRPKEEENNKGYWLSILMNKVKEYS